MKPKLPAIFYDATRRTLAMPLLAACLWSALPDARAIDFYWNNSAGGDWANTNNWLPYTNRPPAAGDKVVITAPGSYTITGGGGASWLTLGDGVHSFPTLMLNQSSFYVAGSAVAASGAKIVLTGGDGGSLSGGGYFEAEGGLELHGTLDWQAGVLGGTVTVAPDGVITGSTALNHFFAAKVYNHGHIIWTANNLTSDGSWLENESDGLVDFQNDGYFGTFGGASSFNTVVNYGMMRKSGGTNAWSFAGCYYVTNAGALEVQSGTVELDNNVSFSGTVSVSNGAALKLVSASVTLHPGYSIKGPGYYGVPPNGSATISGIIGDANFRMDGTLFGTNILTGTMSGYNPDIEGVTTVASGATLNLDACTSCGGIYWTIRLGGTVTNAGAVNWLSGDWTSYGGHLVNAPGGLISIQCDNPLSGWGGLANWLNRGIIRKTASTNVNSCDGMILDNEGVVDVQSGGLTLSAGLSNSGTISVAANTSFNLAGGDVYLKPGSSIAGAGFYGIPPYYSPSVYGDITSTNFQLLGRLNGTNSVSGTVVVANVNYYSPGEFDGATSISPGGVVNLMGASASINGPLTNNGTINWLSGDWNLNYGAPFANLGTVNVQCDNTLASGSPGGWLNLGTVRKRGTTGTTTVTGSGFVNDALLDVQSGAVQFASTYNQTGGQLNFGLTSPSLYGHIIFANPAPLTGALGVNLRGGYSPAYGDSFSLLSYPAASGAFDNFNLPPLTGLKSWSATNSGGALILSIVKAQPMLNATLNGGGLNLGWSSEADPDHPLQYTTNLAPPVVWMEVTNRVQVIGGQNVVNFTSPGGNIFFKLQ